MIRQTKRLSGEGESIERSPFIRRSYASFRDPDGNGWLLQEVTARLPGRVDTNVTTFTSPTELERALQRAYTGREVVYGDKG